MASKKDKSNTEAVVSPSRQAFDSCGGNVIVDELDAVWSKREGEAICGTLSHVYDYRPKRPDASGERKTVMGIALRTTAPCMAVQDKEEMEFPAGSLIGVTLSKKLLPLLDYQPGATIGILAERLVDLGNRQSCWQYKVKAEGKKNPRGSALRPTASVEAEPADAEVDVQDADITDAPF